MGSQDISIRSLKMKVDVLEKDIVELRQAFDRIADFVQKHELKINYTQAERVKKSPKSEQ